MILMLKMILGSLLRKGKEFIDNILIFVLLFVIIIYNVVKYFISIYI
jgi:hypothetical protein